MPNYDPTAWVEGGDPACGADLLNKLEAGVVNAQSDAMVLRGPASQKPAPSETMIGRLYFETDTGRIRWDSGTAWEIVVDVQEIVTQTIQTMGVVLSSPEGGELPVLDLVVTPEGKLEVEYETGG